MKLVVFVEYFPPRLGSDRRIYEIMKRISKTNEIHFVVMPPFRLLSGRFLPEEGKFKFHLQKSDIVEKIDGITAHFSRIPRLILKLWKISYRFAFFPTLIMLFPRILVAVRKINPDVVILNYPSIYTGFLGLITGKMLGNKILLDFNDLIAQYTTDFLDLKRNGLMASFIIGIQNFIAKSSDKIIAPTNFIKEYARSFGVNAKKIFVVPNGVDTEIFDSKNYVPRSTSNADAERKKLCVYCGRIESWAGINIIAKLCDVFQQKHPEVKFLIVGQGKKKITELQNATIMKEVPYEDVPGILSAADVILVPFPRNAVSHAASPLKLFEGMSMQKPVVASNLNGISEVVVDFENGLLADPDNVAEWVEDILYLLNNESIATEIGKKARETVEGEYDWNHIAMLFMKTLNS